MAIIRANHLKFNVFFNLTYFQLIRWVVENNDLVAARHVEREASLLIQHVSLQRTVAHQLDFLFQDFSRLSELVQPCLPLGNLAVELLRRLQTPLLPTNPQVFSLHAKTTLV